MSSTKCDLRTVSEQILEDSPEEWAIVVARGGVPKVYASTEDPAVVEDLLEDAIELIGELWWP